MVNVSLVACNYTQIIVITKVTTCNCNNDTVIPRFTLSTFKNIVLIYSAKLQCYHV